MKRNQWFSIRFCPTTDHGEHIETADSSFAERTLFTSQPKNYKAFWVLGGDIKRAKT